MFTLKLFDEKNRKLKILWTCPFDQIANVILIFKAIVVHAKLVLNIKFSSLPSIQILLLFCIYRRYVDMSFFLIITWFTVYRWRVNLCPSGWLFIPGVLFCSAATQESSPGILSTASFPTKRWKIISRKMKQRRRGVVSYPFLTHQPEASTMLHYLSEVIEVNRSQ